MTIQAAFRAEKKPLAMTLLAIFAIAIGFWASPLSFFPVPWPDDNVYFLAGIEWINWPPVFRMHSQAAFIPSYDIANFNNMPALPTWIGLAHWFGLKTVHALRIFGMFVFAAWVGILVIWMRSFGIKWGFVLLIAGCALFSPTIRWGAMPIHPEVWQGLFWLLITVELARFSQPALLTRSVCWRISFLLAIAALFHFQAIVWVLPVALGLFPFVSDEPNRWILWVKRLFAIFWRTLLFLSPWVFYVFWNWDVFWDQMEMQFGRLDNHGHPFISSLKSFFHSLFVETGNPVGLPKFFNSVKILTWAVLGYAVWMNGKLFFQSSKYRHLRLAMFAALLTTFYLWSTKPETWFVILIHMVIWPFVFLSWVENKGMRRWGTVLGSLVLAAIVVLQVGVAVYQMNSVKGLYSWERYDRWVQCVDRAVGDRTQIWQPTNLDALIYLAGKHPDRSYTRHSDFPDDQLASELVGRSDAIIHTFSLSRNSEHIGVEYEGQVRGIDRYYLLDYPWMQYKQFSALALGEPWQVSICQSGPFWAAISVR